MFIADFHIHSSYSRATSRECVPEMLDLWARRKGLHLIGTGDFTHPAWREELKEKLAPAEEGLYVLREDFRRAETAGGMDFKPRFIISGEISSIYKKNGKVRKVHSLILLPSLEAAETLSHRLELIGNLHSDGRPILGLDCKDLLEITLQAAPDAIFIPAHIWTPHFSLFGAYSGFDDIRECFEDLTGHIHALETGLSSDPPMNWRISALDDFTLVSNSDAHSPGNLAREANLFDTVLSYPHIAQALQNRHTNEFFGTLEFFPEEGKYHYDGHRNCKVCMKPSDTLAVSGLCPVCGGRITKGVLHRVEALADRDEGFVLPGAKHFESLVPLPEVIAASTGFTTASMKVKKQYEDLIHQLGPELVILRELPLEEIELKAGPLIAEGIRRLRLGKVDIFPGYDGEYGKIKILDKGEISLFAGQLAIFNEKTAGGTDKKEKGAKSSVKNKDEKADSPAPAPGDGQTLPDRQSHQQKADVEAAKEFFPDILSGLNREQAEAVSSAGPAIAVIAGPGTGKTRTLVSRIVYLVRQCGVSPAQITAVTFTNKAAQEMRTRLSAYFRDKRTVKAMMIGTFHSIGLKILSGQTADSNITVIDGQDALSIVAGILQDRHLKNSPRDVLKAISLVKSGVSSERENSDLPPEVYDLYNARLAQYGVLDYDDILLNTLQLFADDHIDGTENKRLRNAFTHLLVDEFQDINPTQYRLIRAWGKNSAEIFVIGDPDQSIYGFRGSDSRCFEHFFADLPQARQVRLTQNYRSTPEIIACAQAVIAGDKSENAGEERRTLEAKQASGVKVRLLEMKDDFAEALFVAKEINRMVGGVDMLAAHSLSGPKSKKTNSSRIRGLSDIAVLCRTNRQTELLEHCLLKEGIPYTVRGRGEFLAAPEVRQLIAFFRFLLNPEDGISLKSSSPSAPDQADNWEELRQKYASLVLTAKPSELIKAWISDNGLQDVQSLKLLANIAVLHEDLPAFLQNLLLGQESDIVRSSGKIYSPDAVSLLTLHGAKGLEFPVVFLCGVKDGLIPLTNSKGDCDTDEERRLFYVGLTRAQDELILLASPPGSPFLADIPENILQGEDPFARQSPAYEQINLF